MRVGALGTAQSEGGDGECVVEFDGPAHFLVDDCPMDQRPVTGSTFLKRRHLLQMNYKLVSVPYWEWHDLEPGTDARVEYLKRKMAAPIVKE
jgi:hypothetical protein